MALTLTDWIVIIVILGFLIYQALLARRHMKSVADFLTGGRCARRYLLSIADGAAAMGAILNSLKLRHDLYPFARNKYNLHAYLSIILSESSIFSLKQTATVLNLARNK